MAVVLEEVLVRDVVSGDKRLVFVDENDSLDKALALLKRRNILAMPVRHLEAPRKTDDGSTAAAELKFSGLLGVLDVAAFVARDPEACGEGGEGVLVKQAMRRTAESWHMLLLDPHATVARAMEYLGVWGFHRALVPNVCLSEHKPGDVPLPSALVEEVSPSARGECYQVLSQLDLARFIARHEARFGLGLSQGIESVGLEGSRVLGTTREEKLSDALDRMAGHAVSALAVVDRLEVGVPWAAGDAVLLDTLSASDLRGCTVADLKAARSTTVGDFLLHQHGPPPRPLYTCTKSTEIRTVLKQMIDNSIHRVWVTPKPDVPLTLLGVVSLSDIIRVMRILPVTNTPEDGQEMVDMAFDNFMWMEWNF